MTFTCDIQKVDFFIDQIEDKGQVNLEQAIEIFQNFPFTAQLKEARERELTSCLPTVSFKGADRKALGIWAEDDKGFSIHYDNGTQVADFYLSNDFEKNPEGLAVEEFIELFFKEKIEDELNLIDKGTDRERVEENNENLLSETRKSLKHSNHITFSFNETKKFKFYLWTLLFFALALFLFIADADNNFELGWGLHLLLTFFWLPGTIVHLTYWLKNKGAIVTIDTKAKTLAFEKDGQQIKFNRKNIHHCEINETRSHRAPWNAYRYIWVVLKDKRQVVITNFITDPENILKALKPNYKVNRRTIPFLPI